MKNKAVDNNTTRDFVDNLKTDGYIWFEENWKHEDKEHQHEPYQLTFVAEGYQYFHIAQKVYLVPQNHVIWIPSACKHRSSSEARSVHLMLILFQSVPEDDFYSKVQVFPASNLLKEMLAYAGKWNKKTEQSDEQRHFLQAILNSLPHFCEGSPTLEIPIPRDNRLIPICDLMNRNYSENLNLIELAFEANMSVRNLQRIFKQETGITIQKYQQLIRILKSIELIDSRQYNLSEIAFKIGYQSLSAFTASYQAIMKVKPKAKR